MTLTQLPLAEQFVLTLAALILFTSFLLLAQSRIVSLIHTFAWQGALLFIATCLMALTSGRHHLFISAFMTLALKVFFIPWQLRRLVVRLDIRREVETVGNASLVMIGGGALVLFSYYVVLPIRELSFLATRNTIAISLAVILIGMLMIITRRKAVAQVIGFMSMENGLFFAAVVATYGMPMVVELGVAFDVLVAAILFGIFFFQLRSGIGSLDVDHLNRLHEVDR
ncbi:formate hydrogenlyase [Geothermobacter hydrogeniphilus]|uniref:Formate hydrogenlyase n=1 Tax=Geothermobacter hydrogeniphilus TaxID=1969733 RepID=A0A2K2H9J4_9BACT|nr:formate hydrogenlyase [Geothermobacter hydrogeniphilus]PNU19998.1 formate hydrogenlyase [Geothermobacter hydrogeniphilus]